MSPGGMKTSGDMTYTHEHSSTTGEPVHSLNSFRPHVKQPLAVLASRLWSNATNQSPATMTAHSALPTVWRMVE